MRIRDTLASIESRCTRFHATTRAVTAWIAHEARCRSRRALLDVTWVELRDWTVLVGRAWAGCDGTKMGRERTPRLANCRIQLTRRWRGCGCHGAPMNTSEAIDAVLRRAVLRTGECRCHEYNVLRWWRRGESLSVRERGGMTCNVRAAVRRSSRGPGAPPLGDTWGADIAITGASRHPRGPIRGGGRHGWVGSNCRLLLCRLPLLRRYGPAIARPHRRLWHCGDTDPWQNLVPSFLYLPRLPTPSRPDNQTRGRPTAVAPPSGARRPRISDRTLHTVSTRHTSHTGRGERHSAARVALVAGMRPRSALHAACSNRARGDCRVERLCCGTARLLSPDRPMRCRRHRLRSAAASAPRSDRRPGTRRRPRRADR